MHRLVRVCVCLAHMQRFASGRVGRSSLICTNLARLLGLGGGIKEALIALLALSLDLLYMLIKSSHNDTFNSSSDSFKVMGISSWLKETSYSPVFERIPIVPTALCRYTAEKCRIVLFTLAWCAIKYYSGLRCRAMQCRRRSPTLQVSGCEESSRLLLFH